MNSFDNKEKAEENKYAYDKETQFKIHARYQSHLADWVGHKLHLDAEKLKEYKTTLITYNMTHHDDKALLDKIKHDFLVRDIHVNEHEIRQSMHDLLQKATKEIHGKA